jgi:hypothetical protein
MWSSQFDVRCHSSWLDGALCDRIYLGVFAEEPTITRKKVKNMPPPTPQSSRDETTSAEQAEAAQFYKQLEENEQLVDVDNNTDVSALPAKVTHVRYPDGTVKRIRFTASLYQKG